MPRRTELSSILTYESVRTSDRDGHGMSRSRLMKGEDVEHPFRGVSSAGLDLTTIEGAAKAFLPLMRSCDAISHVSAAQLFGAPLPDEHPPPFPLHVTSIGMRAHRGPNLVGHEWDRTLRRDLIRGIPVVAPADAWCQLAAVLTREDLVAVGDYLVSGVPIPGMRARTAPSCSIAELEDAVLRFGRRPGARNLAWAVQWVRVGADSRPETLLRLLLIAAGLPEPLVQDPTPVGGGRVYKPDLKHKQWRTLYEYEGVVHLRTPQQWRFDARRYQQFEAADWKVIRVNSDHVFVDPAGFIDWLLEVLTKRARELGVAPPLLTRRRRV